MYKQKNNYDELTFNNNSNNNKFKDYMLHNLLEIS